MSRRIIIQQIATRPYPGSAYTSTELELIICGPAGKARLQHDSENLIMAIADLINGGNHTARLGWVINGEDPKQKPPSAMHIIHGWDRDPHARYLEHQEVTATKTIFDAIELVSRGEVIWNAKASGTRTRSPLEDQVLYPTEMLRAAIEVILHPPTPIWPEGHSDEPDLFAPPPAPARWVYRHEGD